MEFTLHPNLSKKIFIADLPLCRVLLEDEKHYPWLLLVPRQMGISKIMDLCQTDQFLLVQELDLVQKLLWEEFQPKQINVAAIGNKTPQLHIHVIARFENDPAWPHTVWDHPVRASYNDSIKAERVKKLADSLTLATNF